MIKMDNKAVLYIICSIVCGAIVSYGNVFAEDVTYEVDVATGINITMPTNTVTLNLTPTNVASFKSSDLPVTVKTNNPTGYTLTMSPSDDTTTDLTRTGGTETIPTLADLSGGYTEQTFTTNKWGYKLSSTNYLPFTTSNEITVTNAPTAASGNTSIVTFAAKGDTTLMSGAYNLEISFAAVANYVPPADVPTTCNTPVPGNYTYLQDINSSNKAAVLDSLTEGSAYFLRDSRDNEPYCISKLADGNLWFLDNLRLDLTNSTVLNTLSSANTNIASATETATLTSLKSGNRSAGDQYATAGVTNWTSGYSFSAPLIAISGNCEDTTYCANDPESGKWHKDATTTSYGSGSGKIGVYYNYCAASAGSYCYGNRTSAGTSSGDATEDICPKGWRIPTGGDSGEYQVLYTAYNSNASDFKNALSTPLSGNFNYGSASGQKGYYGSFWSSKRLDNSNFMDHLYVESSSVDPSDLIIRHSGSSVRCLLQ